MVSHSHQKGRTIRLSIHQHSFRAKVLEGKLKDWITVGSQDGKDASISGHSLPHPPLLTPSIHHNWSKSIPFLFLKLLIRLSGCLQTQAVIDVFQVFVNELYVLIEFKRCKSCRFTATEFEQYQLHLEPKWLNIVYFLKVICW